MTANFLMLFYWKPSNLLVIAASCEDNLNQLSFSYYSDRLDRLGYLYLQLQMSHFGLTVTKIFIDKDVFFLLFIVYSERYSID